MTENRQQLRDAFADPKSRRHRTVASVDMVGATATKESQPQATWLNSLGWLYDRVNGILADVVPDAVVKYLGDGIMFVVDTDRTTEAVNAAIQIQEAINKASQGTGDAAGVVDFACSIGISTGEVVEFLSPHDNLDFVGTVVDKAFRLCAAANAKAIFIDTTTLGAANMIRIAARLGSALGWQPDQYQGDVQRAVLPGFVQPVAYHEIKWDQQLYGVKSETVTASTERLRPAVTRSTPAVGTAGRAVPRTVERHRGEITNWRADRGFGFVRDPATGEDFHFSSRLLVYPDDTEKLAPGREVTFAAVGALEGDKKRQAGALLVVGEPADGRLVNLQEDRPYGWIRVEDDLGHHNLVYVARSELTGRKVGDLLGFTVGATDKGAFARQVESLEDAEAA
jgi:class 3 adenylate cyclase/cold shock CspA family protein